MSNIFSSIYSSNKWSMCQNDSKSGLGSSEVYTVHIQNILKEVVNEFSIRSMIDTSCGDWYWMKKVRSELSCSYLGIDIVSDIVHENTEKYGDDTTMFLNSDILSYLKTIPDKSVDLILCRHTLEHLPTEYNIEFMNECRRVCSYLLLTTHTLSPENRDLSVTSTPYRPINLKLYPYVEVIGSNFTKSFYDGPITDTFPEMFINLYTFGV